MADSMLDIATKMGDGLGAMGKAVKTAIRDVAKDGAAIARQEHRKTAAAATGGDGRYSGLGAAGRLDIRVRYDDEGATIVPKGTWKIAEEGAEPHVIRPKKKRSLRLSDGSYREGEMQHPGTKAKQGRKAWTKAEAATIQQLDRTIPAKVDSALEAGFRNG